MYHYRNNPGDRVRVEASPHSGDGRNYNGRVGIVVGHDLDWDDDRVWPEVRVQFGPGEVRNVLDYNLKPA